MNYFNYFTEIEDTFIRRRGKHLLLSPMDWALIESWKEMGVPLHVALRGIERAFDSHEAKPRRRSVKTLFYCQEEVEAQYAEWLDSQVGATSTSTSAPANGEQADGEEETEREAGLPFSRASIIEHLARAHAQLKQICGERKKNGLDALCDALARAASRLQSLEKDFARARRPNAESLEVSLSQLEGILDEALRLSVAPAELASMRAETETQLQPYRNRMERETYEQTLDNLVLKRLRDRYGMPRLSLFYL